jgi:pilus assembly protein CpaE
MLGLDQATVAVIDLDASMPSEMQAFERLMSRIGSWPPVIVLTQSFDATVARTLLQMRVADFMVKPIEPVELVRTCVRVAKEATASADGTEAEIYTFLPAVGGAGVTTLALQTAMTLLSGGPGGKSSTCLVDLDFQHGACADYLDIEPRLNLGEIEPRPERLDRQLLEVMLSHHPSGLAVIAAPNKPAEMRSFDPDVVTRLLDMVSTHFDYVVFDMPRTWFSWTDSVLLGSNRLFIVSEMTVPGLRHAKQLVEAIRERLGDGPKPQVIINRFVQKMFSSGLRKGDIEQVLGDAFACCIPNNYGLVREAIDRGVPLEEIKPGNPITVQIKKLVLPQSASKSAVESGPKKLKLSWAR